MNDSFRVVERVRLWFASLSRIFLFCFPSTINCPEFDDSFSPTPLTGAPGTFAVTLQVFLSTHHGYFEIIQFGDLSSAWTTCICRLKSQDSPASRRILNFHKTSPLALRSCRRGATNVRLRQASKGDGFFY